MKLTLIPIFLFAIATSFLQAQHFETDFEQVKEISHSQDKTIMLVFSGSDWCKPCILLKKEILNTPEFSAFSEQHLVVLNLDFPYQKRNRLSKEQTEHNEKLADVYNPRGDFPLVLILNEDFSVAKRIAYSPNMKTEAFLLEIETSITQP